MRSAHWARDDEQHGKRQGREAFALAVPRGLVPKGDLVPHLGLFYRSDHKEFAAAGVPSLSMRRGSEYLQSC
jgi:hypothetical protein